MSQHITVDLHGVIMHLRLIAHMSFTGDLHTIVYLCPFLLSFLPSARARQHFFARRTCFFGSTCFRRELRLAQ